MYFVCMCVNTRVCLLLPHCVSVTPRQQLGGAWFLGSGSIFPDIKRRWQCLTAAGGNTRMEYNTTQRYLHNSARDLWPLFWASLPLFSDFRLGCALFPHVFTLHSALQMFPLFVCFFTFVSYFSFLLLSRMLVPPTKKTEYIFIFSLQHSKNILRATWSSFPSWQQILWVSPSAGWDQAERNIYFLVTNNGSPTLFHFFFIKVLLLLCLRPSCTQGPQGRSPKNNRWGFSRKS